MQANGAMTLKPDDISRLRRNAQRSQYRRVEGTRVPVIFTDGPLNGIKITALEYEAAGVYLGFAVLTETGAVQALYCRDQESSD